jgi:transposase
LTQIEDIVLVLREKLSQAMLDSVLENQEAVQPVELCCPKCGQRMRYKERKEKVVESRVGEVDLERGHYDCTTCKEGIFPLDQQLKLDESDWSEAVSRLTVWLRGLTAFARAA